MKFRSQLALAAFTASLAFAPAAFADDMGMAPSSGTMSNGAMSAPATDKDKKDEMKKDDKMAPDAMAPASGEAMAPDASHDAMSAPGNAMKQ
jgi:hypothetical protein